MDNIIEQLKNILICPIGFNTINKPIIASDNHIYEKLYFIEYCNKNTEIKSPITRNTIDGYIDIYILNEIINFLLVDSDNNNIINYNNKNLHCNLNKNINSTNNTNNTCQNSNYNFNSYNLYTSTLSSRILYKIYNM